MTQISCIAYLAFPHHGEPYSLSPLSFCTTAKGIILQATPFLLNKERGSLIRATIAPCIVGFEVVFGDEDSNSHVWNIVNVAMAVTIRCECLTCVKDRSYEWRPLALSEPLHIRYMSIICSSFRFGKISCDDVAYTLLRCMTLWKGRCLERNMYVVGISGWCLEVACST